MLGRIRRTTRLDVALGLAFSGVAYLTWNLVTSVARGPLGALNAQAHAASRPVIAEAEGAVAVLVNAGFLVDTAGVVWMAITLGLVVRSGHQRISISWAWISALCQVIAAAAMACWAMSALAAAGPVAAAGAGVSLPIMLAVGLAVWATFLVWLLIERARLGRLGPTLRDGLRTNIYR